MADVLYLLLTLIAFGALLLLVRGCASIVGTTDVVDDSLTVADNTPLNDGDPR